MKYCLPEGIPNNDLLDGTKVRFKFTKHCRSICLQNKGVASNKQYVGLSFVNPRPGNLVVERSDAPGNTETFLIVWKHGDRSRVRIQASNGLFEQIFNSTSQICIFVKIGKL